MGSMTRFYGSSRRAAERRAIVALLLCASASLRESFSIPSHRPLAPRIGAPFKLAVGTNADAVGAAPGFVAGLRFRHAPAGLLQRLNELGTIRIVPFKLERLVLAAQPWGVDGLLHVHVMIDDIDQHLGDDVDDLRTAGGANGHVRLALLEHDDRRHAAAGTLAGQVVLSPLLAQRRQRRDRGSP